MCIYIYYSRVSDHAPVVFTFNAGGFKRATGNALPKHWCASPYFRECLLNTINSVEWDNLDPLEQLTLYKLCLVSAAKAAGSLLFRSGCSLPDQRRQALESISRCIWHNDVVLRRKLLRVSELAREMVFIDNGVVVPFSAVEFEAVYVKEKLDHLNRETQDLQRQARSSTMTLKKQIKSKIQCCRRKMWIWFSKDRRLKLQGLREVRADGS